jgi:putative spermidine/putrescine transport system ATP-binding protein
MTQSGLQLDVEQVAKRFGGFAALHEINLSVGRGELISLLGPSGCGKTTLLRIIAGFERQSAGSVRFDGAPVDGLKPAKRGIGIVFQNYALFPHMTVRQNIAYGLDAHGWPRERKAARVQEMLALVQMTAFGDRRPAQLSGGQQQRIALARCLATEPGILLLDEPFGALDKNLRLDMQIEVKRLQRSTGITTLMVTHDQEEALSMSDRIAVMNKGRIEQVGSPTEVYDQPATLFVNQFVGTANLLPGTMLAPGQVRLDSGVVLEGSGLDGSTGPVWVSVRPEHLVLQDGATPGALPGSVTAVLPLGPSIAYELETPDGVRCKVISPRGADMPAVEPGAALFMRPASPACCRLFPREP